MKKVLIAMPNQGNIQTETVESLISTISTLQFEDVQIVLHTPQHTLLTKSRDLCVEELMRHDYTHIFWIDSDMVFTPNDFKILLDSDKDIICAPCRIRSQSDIKLYNIAREDGSLFSEMLLETYPDLFDIKYTGMAFMCCKKEIFENFEGFRFTKEKSEGGNFCEDMDKLGYFIHCDKESRPGHKFSQVNY